MPEWIETDNGAWINADRVAGVKPVFNKRTQSDRWYLFDDKGVHLGTACEWPPKGNRQYIPCPPGWDIVSFWPEEDGQPEAVYYKPILAWVINGEMLEALTPEGPDDTDRLLGFGKQSPDYLTAARSPAGVFYAVTEGGSLLLSDGLETFLTNARHALSQMQSDLDRERARAAAKQAEEDEARKAGAA